MTQMITMIFSLIAVFGVFVLAVLVFKRLGGATSGNTETFKKELQDIRNELHGTFEKNLNFLEQHSGKSTEIIRDVTSRLEQVLATNKQVVDFAGQLQSLENILKNPKHRGALGEYFLEKVLSQVLPGGTYKMQYKFQNGDIVDAAIILNNTIIPIDAKFSLEKYSLLAAETDASRRETLEKELKVDLKKRIDETSKYVRVDEGTASVAIMYVPAENVLQGLNNVNYEDLVNYAHGKRVMISTPNTFFAYLQIIMQALKVIKFQDSAKDIIKRVDELGKHLLRYDEYMKKLGGHLGTTVSMYNQAYKEFAKVDKDIHKLAGSSSEKQVETMELDKPRNEL